MTPDKILYEPAGFFSLASNSLQTLFRNRPKILLDPKRDGQREFFAEPRQFAAVHPPI